MGLKVLSLFDGISCGRLALQRAGIKVDSYYASEINKHAIKVTQNNWPDTIQLGDITQLSNEILDKLGPFDIIIGGSPCQDLSGYKSFSGDNKGLEGSKSGLFYHFVRILKHINPKYFLLENVPMEEKWKIEMSELVGVEPEMINSNVVCAAERKRLYWTNIPYEKNIEDKGVVLKDIVIPHHQVPDKYWYDKDFVYNGDEKKVQCTIDIKGHRNMKEVYNLNGKCNTLLADGDGGNRQKKVYQNGKCRKLMPVEYERLQTLPDNYTDCVSDSARYSAIGNGWTVDVISHIFKGLKK